jgi:DNA polymerase III epsilon subunit-like protein
MKLLIFDTETTGLPKARNPATHGPNNWPHLVSISWVVLDSETNSVLKERSYIIKPNWDIPIESTKIHGITNEHAILHGHDLRSVMVEFMTEACDIIVAHNMEFDNNVITNALLWDLNLSSLRVDVDINVNRPKQVCTMKLSKELCRISGKYGYKYPKLKELYFHAFKKMPDETKLHNSLYDVLVLTEVIQTYLPLRQAMGLVVRSVDTLSNGV